MRKILSLVASALCAAACIYPYTPDIEEAPEGIMAVDGDICIGDISWVRLGPLYSLWPSDEYKGWWGTQFIDATVWVEDDAGERYPGVQYALPGNSTSYYSSATFRIDTQSAPKNRSYRLCIEALGEMYASDWNAPIDAPEIESIDFVADEDNVTVAVTVDGGEHGTGYLLLSYDETWEFHAEFYPNYSYDPRTMGIQEMTPEGYDEYWCFQYADNGRALPIDYSGMTATGIRAFPLHTFPRSNQRNHRRYSVNVKAKSISPATYRFLKTLEESTDGGDNLFTPNPGEIASNLRCESDPERTVLGYVVVSCATTKRAFLDSRYLKSRRPDVGNLLYLLADRYSDYYARGYLPLVENTMANYDPSLYGPYGWGPRACYDCIAAGGTKTRPDYWDE